MLFNRIPLLLALYVKKERGITMGLAQKNYQQGFTLIELTAVIVILGVIAAVAVPKFTDLSRAARITTLEGIQGTMLSTVTMVKGLAYINGLSAAASNTQNQSVFLVETEAGSSELDWRNLCPESQAELGDALSMLDYINLGQTSGLITSVDNRYTRIGYDINGSGNITSSACYLTYDSFGLPNCTVSLTTSGC
jgi:MSHA pilin protein MshA